jgi:RNA binding exosome subunit
MKPPIASLEATYFIHETEDPSKVDMAVKKLLGTEASAEKEALEGHFGNKIERARVHLTGDEAASSFSAIVRALPDAVRMELMSDLEPHLDEHSALFLRLDKQLLVSGKIALGAGDAVRLKVKPRLFLLKGGASGFYRNELEKGRAR